MRTTETNILRIQLRTSEVITELVSDDVLHASPNACAVHGTGITLSSHTVLSQPQAESQFPFLKASMVFTAFITVASLHMLRPASSDFSAMAGQNTGTRSSSRIQYSPDDERRIQRAQRHYAAPENASQSESSSESSQASSASDSSASAPSSAAENPPSSSSTSSEALPDAASSSSAASVMPAPDLQTFRADNQIGIYLTASSVQRKDFFNATIDSLMQAGGTALIFDVKGGSVLFHSAAPMANEINLVVPFYELPDVLKVAHDKGLYTMGRFVAIKDGGLTQKKPATRVRNPKTGAVISQDWVDPSDDTAIEYNMQVICELAGYGIDEINLDYIRFSTAQFGALGVFSGEEKANRVEKFIKAARDTINRCGPKTRLGLSTFAILGWDYKVNVETLGQDVVRFAPLVACADWRWLRSSCRASSCPSRLRCHCSCSFAGSDCSTRSSGWRW